MAARGVASAPDHRGGLHVVCLPRHLRRGYDALSREGCRHYEVFDRSDEDFGREIFKVEDPVVKDAGGALFDRMWGPHGREAVREQADRARDRVKFVFCFVLWNVGGCWCTESVCYAADGAC
jgi:hypothetical protein